MKTTRKLLALVMAALMLLSLAACGGNQSQTNNPGASIKLKIVAADFGFGTNWLKAIAQAYMAKNRDVSITVENTPIPHQLISQIEGGLDTYDIVFATSGSMGTLGEKGVFINLDDVYAATTDGKTVVDKLGNLATAIEYKGHYYSLPYVSSPWGMVVNHDTMRALFGENYTLPNTTDEFLALCNDIKSKGAYAFIDSYGYSDSLTETWWYQYDSIAANNYWNALYTDENGETKLATNGESLNQPGKLLALQLVEKLTNPKYGYNHQYATTMNFTDAQIAFLGQGYGNVDNKLVAFMPNGAWLENEMELVLSEYPADFALFRVPVISEIINVLPDKSVESDAELSALIAAIDAGATALSGTGYAVTQNDFDYIKNARYATAQNATAHTAAVTSSCKNPEAAKDFLTFLTTDEASAIAARQLKGVTLPFGYTPSEGNGYDISNYIKSVISLTANANYIARPYTVAIANGLGLSKMTNLSLCAALRNGNKTAEEVYNSDNASYLNEWRFIIAGLS